MIYDVAIIGAGPAGLAVAARLREATPSALFTDDEHRRYWRRFNRRETIQNESKIRRRLADTDPRQNTPLERSIIVLDAVSDKWMGAWGERFRKLQIDHLRSPLFFHPDPRDRDALLTFSHFSGRACELQEIHNVVGKEISKHRIKKTRQRKTAPHLRIDDRDRVDYFTPSTQVFHDFCEDIVDRYHLRNVVVQARVENIEYGDLGGLNNGKYFTLTTNQEDFFSKFVVLAVGPGWKPGIPMDSNLQLGDDLRGVCHCLDPAGGHYLPEHVLQRIDKRLATSVVVVGGGLTSAQVADLIIRRGVTKVWLLLRGRYKVKHFDVDLEWVSKVRNQQMSVFWSADSDEERFKMLSEARNGGSITPKFDKILQRHIANGRLAVLTHTQIEDGIWSSESRTWSLKLSSAPHQFPHSVDHVIYATGAGPNIEKVPCIQRMRQDYFVQSINGLPQLTDDLMWDKDIPLFLTGGLAGLRLGPGAANLAGARQGAERIAWKIDELLDRGQNQSLDNQSPVSDNVDRSSLGEGERKTLTMEWSEYSGRFANQFQALMLDKDG
ncbi:hypothetical protein B0A52_04883 [Exophiala mesophila]|uniref:L-ornithine N(5)-monooxygenase n=1 Tax=Exophiala mesophila TaxID=212818 RepID=A0A438N6B1_EXOME|nr:hypothetical protein B0A52_04883 [Exophiala mesophila]